MGKRHVPISFTYSRLPMWTEEYLKERIEELRAMGLKNVYFKMAGFDRADMELGSADRGVLSCGYGDL